MRPCYVVKKYYLLHDSLQDHMNMANSVLGPPEVTHLETYKVRDRLGVNPTLSGSGPFFGANIMPYAVFNGKLLPGTSYLVTATGSFTGDDQSQFGFIDRHVYCLGDWTGEWYAGYHPGAQWSDCNGTVWHCEWTDLYIDGIRQWKLVGNQFRLTCYPGEKKSWTPLETLQFVLHLARLPYRVYDTDGLTGYFDTSYSFVRVSGSESMSWQLQKCELYSWNTPSLNLLRHNEWAKADALASGMSTNFYYSGCNAAFQGCVDNLPELMVNTAQNIMDIVEAVWSLMTGDPTRMRKLGLKTIPKTAGEAWMFYRYVYTTSKADLEEYVALTNRLGRIAKDMPYYLYSYGQYREDDYTFHCVMRTSTSSVFPQDARRWLKAYGLKLSMADLWDDVPYSFVVDWFLHIGDILEYVDRLGKAIAYRNEECWYSISTAYNGVNTYCRVPGNVIPYFPPAFHFTKAKTKTWFKRFVDGLVLIGP